MEEQIISLETAKLAKEKGFGKGKDYILLHTYYKPDKTLVTEPTAWKRDNSTTPHGSLQLSSVEAGVSQGMDNYCEYILAPTQSLLQKWLREIHKEVVYCIPANKKCEHWTACLNGKVINIGAEDYSYEEALEKGLQRALKNV